MILKKYSGLNGKDSKQANNFFPRWFWSKIKTTLPQFLAQGRNRWKCGWAPADCQRWKFDLGISEQINETKWTPPHPHDHPLHDHPPAHDYGHLHVQPLLLAGEVVAAAPPMLPLTHLIIIIIIVIIIVIIRMIMTIKMRIMMIRKIRIIIIVMMGMIWFWPQKDFLANFGLGLTSKRFWRKVRIWFLLWIYLGGYSHLAATSLLPHPLSVVKTSSSCNKSCIDRFHLIFIVFSIGTKINDDVYLDRRTPEQSFFRHLEMIIQFNTNS